MTAKSKTVPIKGEKDRGKKREMRRNVYREEGARQEKWQESNLGISTRLDGKDM